MLPRSSREEREAQEFESMRIALDEFKRTSPAARSSAVCYQVLQSKMGYQLFLEDQELRNSLTTREVNEVTSKGKNILQLIAAKPQGREMIAEDHSFRGKITAAGFKQGERTSAAFYFITCDRGCEILKDCYDLFGMIPASLLNDTHEDYSPPCAFLLSKFNSGVNLLIRLFQEKKLKIETINLNFSGQTIFYNMMKFPDGLKALAIPEFRRCISAEALNLSSINQQTSALYLICESAPEYIADKKSLAAKIDAEAFNLVKYGKTPAVILAKSAAGCSAYLKHKSLVRMLDESTLQAVSSGREDEGGSLVFWLLVRSDGRDVIRANPFLLQRLSYRTCFSEIKAGLYAGNSIALLLQRQENVDLLNLLPDELREVVRLSVPERDNLQEQELLAAKHRFFSNRYPLQQEDEKEEQKNCRLM
jgi:hypothetical protein